MEIRFRELTRWIGDRTPADQRLSPYRFKKSEGSMIRKFREECHHLDARTVTVEASFKQGAIRNDGWPYSNAKCHGPDIIVTIEGKHGTLVYPVDCCHSWQHNLYALALTLERLRESQMYGIGQSGEAYSGWKALPAGEGVTTDARKSAAQVLVRFAGWDEDRVDALLDNGDMVRNAYRNAAKATHPDHGGHQKDFEAVTRAFNVLTGDAA